MLTAILGVVLLLFALDMSGVAFGWITRKISR
ncbi:hypothetical protein QO012_002589 [Methylobacterium aerolatum]|uniref:Uncharacterized protein n=1 Tax=Methylobacterium aerolatum TaxID=418708 RepID=A0ABU0I0G3_9HYPH|nr:hypothetical protein [Methylobacterium aerolatum]GJD36445.1 hypothetical protein FMGBMHLM_3365 [Methylobacterium aerolatum]